MMENYLFTVPAHTAQTFIFASILFAILTFLPNLGHRLKVVNIPLYNGLSNDEEGKQFFITSAKKIYVDGYRQFKDTLYRITAWDYTDVIMVPPSMLDELRRLPDNVLDGDEASAQVLESKYTGLGGPLGKFVADVIRGDLTPALPRLQAEFLEEVDIAMDYLLPRVEYSKPTGVQISTILGRLVAQVSGRLFVGTELCRNSDYIDCSNRFALEIFTAAGAVKKMNPWLRPLLASRLPEVKAIQDRERRAIEVIGSIIRQRKEAEKADPTWQKPNDMMQWMIARSNDQSIEGLTKRQLMLTFAAIHTTTTVSLNVIYTLAAMPEYVSEIREEVQDVLAKNDGVLTAKALQQLLKLDSFMREVNLIYPPILTSFNRYVQQPFTLSNGQHIPAGVKVKAMAFGIRDHSDPQNPLNEFDGLRHYKQRISASNAGVQARNQFVASSEENMAFGFGRHACPGRFFAATQIKIIVAKLLLNFDIGMPDGMTERHAQLFNGDICEPDPTKEIVLKRLQS